MRGFVRPVMAVLLAGGVAAALLSPTLALRALGVLILAACPLSCVALLVFAGRSNRTRNQRESSGADGANSRSASDVAATRAPEPITE